MIDLPTTRYSGGASKKYKAKFWGVEYAEEGIHHRGAEGTKVGIVQGWRKGDGERRLA